MKTFWISGLALVVLGAGCQGSASDDPSASGLAEVEPTPTPSALPNVVVLLADTARAESFSAYGNPKQTSPFFDEFAGENYLFENAYAPCSWTRPSVASIFTGAYPQRHDVQMRQDVLAEEVPTLAEELGRAGYHTYIINTNPHITQTWGVTQGFEHQTHLMPHPDQFKAGNGANTVLRHLRRTIPELEEPFFLYVHVIDPHYPFEPPDEDMEALGFDPKTKSWVQKYQGEIHFTDRHFKTMLGALEQQGHLDNAMVIITSDHGDEFGEHGSTGHGKTLYQEVVKIPLALSLPPSMRQELGQPDRGPMSCGSVPNNVSLVDLMPTVLELLELPPPPLMDGESWVPLMRCERPADTRPLYFSIEKEKTSLAGALVGHSKLIVNRSTGQRDLYLLDENPRERNLPMGARSGMRELKRNLGDLLETFEWSVQPGLHLEIASKDGVKDRQDVVLYLRTTGRFADVTTHNFEKNDTTFISKDGRFMRVDSRLRAFWHRSPKHVWVQDRDELRIQLDPPNADLMVSARLNGKRAPMSILKFPQARGRYWPMALTQEERMDADSLVDRRAAGIYIFERSRAQPTQVAQVSEEIHEALRALGYIQ